MPRTCKRTRTQTRVKCKLCGGFVKKQVQSKRKSSKDIPGYYYDEEKKRYFKITNDHKDKLKIPKKTEEIFCEKCKLYKEQQTKKRQSSSLVKQIFSQQYKDVPYWCLRRQTLENLICSYHVKQKIDIPLTHVDPCNFAVCSIQPDINHRKILTLYKTKNAEQQIVQFHQVERESKNQLKLSPGTAMMKKQAVTSLNWSPHQKTSEYFLMSLLGCEGNWGEGMLFHTNEELMQTFISRYPMNYHSVWTSAWCPNPLYDHVIALGASKMALTFDVNTRRRMLRFLANTDVLSQEFATRSPLLFNGFRNGDMKSCDVRLSGSRESGVCMAQDKPITSLKLMKDEVYLIIGGMDDTIRRWDLRMLNQVNQEYHGHCNSLTLGLPMFLDPTETLLFAAGEDSVTRVWSVGTGELVHTIPYPIDEKTNISAIPALYYSDQWGGPGGPAGLFYGTNEVIHWYGM